MCVCVYNQSDTNSFLEIAKKIPLESLHSSGGRGAYGGRNGPGGLNNGVNLMQQTPGSKTSGACAC